MPSVRSGILAGCLAVCALQAQTPARSRTAAQLDRARLFEAARLLNQASIGASHDEVVQAARLGPEGWIESQFARPITRHQAATRQIRAMIGERGEDILPPLFAQRFAWWQQTITADDVLRQRVALALSEILVVSNRVDFLALSPEGVSSYYDLLLDNAFGNYRDLLMGVTLHPAMGVYLSHLNNDRSNPASGRFPDENYAREVMQLFSIGLNELNPDGSLRLDTSGRPIPTYTNREITELAKVFTGLGPGGSTGTFGQHPLLADLTVPMRMYDQHHEPGEKRLLRGVVLPGGQSGMRDVEQAVDHLFNHPNTGPFIGRLLIQRLVTSNPSPDYIARVAAAFANNGQGVRGDMRAVLRAILLDSEARDPGARPASVQYGRLQEPFVRFVALARTFEATSPSGLYFTTGVFADLFINQHAMSSPSVFNFFLPDHQPQGAIAEAGLVGPEFEIANTATLIGFANLMDVALLADRVGEYLPELTLEECDRQGCAVRPVACEDLATGDPAPCLPAALMDFESLRIRLDLSAEMALAADSRALVDRLDLLLTYGSLSPQTRATVLASMDRIPDPFLRVRAALYLILISPDYAVAN